MSLFKERPRGRLSGEDLDTLVRWSLRDGVDGAAPSGAVWQRTRAAAEGRRRSRSRRARWSLQRLVPSGPYAGLPVPFEGLGGGLAALARFVVTNLAARREVRDTQVLLIPRPPQAFAGGMLLAAFASRQQIY
jgi:hypothetical protein